jgi:chromate transport protein ChrA
MNQVPALIRVFSYLSILTVGGGMAAFPEMKILTVDVHKWMTFQQLIHMYSVGQMAPGPNMMMIVSIGQWAGGTLGAIAVLVAFFGPTAILAFAVAKGWRKLENIHSAGPSSGVNRPPAGRLFHYGKRRHLRLGNRRTRCRRPVDPAAIQDQPRLAGGV